MGHYAETAPDGAADAIDMALDELIDAVGDERLELMLPDSWPHLLAEATRRKMPEATPQ